MRTELLRDGHEWLRIADPSWTNPLDPTFAQRTGGRWNPPDSYPTLYLNEDLATVHAQVRHLFAGRGVEPDDLDEAAFDQALYTAGMPDPDLTLSDYLDGNVASLEEIILEKNVFVERILPASILRALSDDEMAEYRRPFANPGEDRRPTLTWPREIPIDGSPEDVAAIVGDYSRWLSTSSVPKLFVNAEPGAILVGEPREFCRTWPSQAEVTVAGSHFIQEDSADEIGRSLRRWMEGL